jgi:hypothetical protein
MYSITEDRKMLLMSVILSLVIILGLLGNIINVIVFLNKSMKQKSTFRYLIYLSLLDSFILITCAIDSVLTFSNLAMIRLVSNVWCKFHTYISFDLIHLKSLILVVICCDLIIKRPQIKQLRLRLSGRKSAKNNLEFKKQKNDRRRTRLNINDWIFFGLCIMVALINFHYMIFLNLNNFSNTRNQTQHSLGFNTSIRNFPLKFFHVRNIYEKKTSIQNLSNILSSMLKTNQTNSKLHTSIRLCHPQIKSKYRLFILNISIWIDIFITQCLPILLTLICLILFIKQNNNIKRLKFSFTSNSDRNYLKLMLTLIILNIYFIFSSLPFNINSILFSFKDINNETHLFQVIFQILAYTSNSFSCFVYLTFLTQYKHVLSIFILGDRKSNIQSISHPIINKRKINGVTSSSNATGKKMVRFSMNEQETAELKLMDALIEITRV